MIYIEQIILIDLLIHHILVLFTGLITLIDISKKRLLISDLLSVLIVISYFELHFNIRWEWCFIMLVAVISFRANWLAALVYFLLNATLGGISSILYFNYNYHWFYLLIILVIFLLIIFYYLYKYKGLVKKGLYYEAKLKGSAKKLFLYLDTGNKLFDNKNRAVIILNKKYMRYFTIKEDLIEINTINGSTREVSYQCRDFYILIKRRYIRFTGSVIFRDNVGDGIIGLNVIGG